MTFKDLEDKGVELERTLRGEAGKTRARVRNVKTPPRPHFKPRNREKPLLTVFQVNNCQHANDANGLKLKLKPAPSLLQKTQVPPLMSHKTPLSDVNRVMWL